MSTDTHHTEKELFRRISEGDEEAFASIFHRYRSPLFDYALKITRSVDAAEELVQESFLKLWTYRYNLEGIGDTRAYIHSIARNASLDYFRRLSLDRRMQQRVLATLSPGVETTLEELDLGETRRLVQEAMDRLSPQQYEVFRLSRYEGLAYAEIADRLGIAPNTVRNHLVKALAVIRDYLAAQYGGAVVLVIMHFLEHR